MSAQEAEHVASVTHLPTTRATPDEPTPALLKPEPRITLDAIRDVVTPPDIWSDDRPSLRKQWLYARFGRWTRETGFVRFAGKAYTWFSMAVHALAYVALWIVERPSRFAVAATVAALVYLAF